MAIAVDLLTRGYFPRELPPPFTTHGLGAFVAVAANRAELPAQSRPTMCVSHNLARPGSLRRPLKLPNPAHHIPLVEEIQRQWPALIAQCWRSRLSASGPMLRRRIMVRAIVPRYQHGLLSRLRSRRFVGGRYFLRTDINQFYSSIYTHSIPWAMHGKAHAKANIGRTQGDRIDKGFRDQQGGQTIGLPIGPDSSLVIAELILSTVDVALGRLKGLRHVDDYELAFRSMAEAESALNDLQGLLADYELSLNPRKTAIIEGPIAFDETWVVQLRSFPFRAAGPQAELNDAVAFFSLAFELAKEHPQHAVLRYAAVVAQRWNFTSVGWPTFQSLLLNAATADPAVLPMATVLFERHRTAGHALGIPAIQGALESTIARHAPLGHGSEVAWALWTAIQFGATLTTEAARKISLMEDDIVALLALHANAQGLFPAQALDQGGWTRLVGLPDALSDEHWLLAYEANRQGWLPCAAVAADPFWGVLERNRISFYDRAAKLEARTGAAAAAPGGALALGYW